jgi:hypothetical protein
MAGREVDDVVDLASGHSMVIAGQTAVRNAIAAAIASGAFQKIETRLKEL